MKALEHRIPPPIVVLAIGVLMWVTARYTLRMPVPDFLRLVLATSVFALGLLIGGSGFLAFRLARTTIDPVHLDAASVLVTSGIFRISRNPMYVGFALLLTAWAVYLSAPWAFVGVAVFVLFTSQFQVLPEERVMRAKFGATYADYQREVRRWL